MTFTTHTELMRIVMEEAAQRELIPRFGTSLPAEAKSGGEDDPVTVADKASSNYVLSRIQPDYPGSFSEEKKHNPDRWIEDLLWELDPLDGTREFRAAEQPELKELMKQWYALQASLLQRQDNGVYQPVASVLHLPGIEETWTYDGEHLRLRKSGQEQPLPELIVPTETLRGWDRYVDDTLAVDQAYAAIAKQLNMTHTTEKRGAAGSSVADLLRGDIDLIVFPLDNSCEWDVPLLKPLIEARGGWVTDLHGAAFTYNRQNAPGYDQPYNLKGYVASITLPKEKVIPHIPKGTLKQVARKTA